MAPRWRVQAAVLALAALIHLAAGGEQRFDGAAPAGVWQRDAPSRVDFVLQECCRYMLIDDATVPMPPEFQELSREESPGKGRWIRLPRVVPAKAKAHHEQLIPRHIFCTVRRREVRHRLAIALAMWVHLNPEYTIYVLDDEALNAWLHNHANPKVIQALQALEAHLSKIGQEKVYGVHKADLWRILILQRYGGVYIDVDVVPVKPLREFPIRPDDVAVELVRSYGTIHQDFIISAASTCHLKYAVDLILANFKRADAGNNTHRVVHEMIFDDDGNFVELGGFIPLDLYAQRRVEQVSGPVAFHQALEACARTGGLEKNVRFLRDDCGSCRTTLYYNDCSQCAFTSSYIGYQNDVRETYWGNYDTSVAASPEERRP